MRILRLFFLFSPLRASLSLIFAILSGAFYAVLIPLVISFISHDFYFMKNVQDIFGVEIYSFHEGSSFLVACFFAWFFRSLSQVLMINIYSDIKMGWRIDLYNKLSDKNDFVLKSDDPEEVLSTFYEELGKISVGSTATPYLIINIIAIFSMTAFLFLVKPVVFPVVITSVAICILFWEILMRKGMNIYGRTILVERELKNLSLEVIRSLKIGTAKKEIESLKERLIAEEHVVLSNDRAANRILLPTHSFSDLISPAVVGFVCFVWGDYVSLTKDDSLAIVIAVLFIHTPLKAILVYIPQVLMASSSYIYVSGFLSGNRK